MLKKYQYTTLLLTFSICNFSFLVCNLYIIVCNISILVNYFLLNCFICHIFLHLSVISDNCTLYTV